MATLEKRAKMIKEVYEDLSAMDQEKATRFLAEHPLNEIFRFDNEKRGDGLQVSDDGYHLKRIG